MAHRPTWYTIEKILELLKYSLQDNSEQLKWLKFKKVSHSKEIYILLQKD